MQPSINFTSSADVTTLRPTTSTNPATTATSATFWAVRFCCLLSVVDERTGFDGLTVGFVKRLQATAIETVFITPMLSTRLRLR